MAASRWGDSRITMVRSSTASSASRSARALPLRGRKPSMHQRAVGRPLAATAATGADGPGTTSIRWPASTTRRTTLSPGSEIPGMPASETRATVPPSSRRRITSVAALSSVCSSRRSRSAPTTPAWASRRPVLRVSSQATRSAAASVSTARGERSPRLPMGVATSTKWAGPAAAVLTPAPPARRRRSGPSVRSSPPRP